MINGSFRKASVLVYTMVLVVLGVFMATVVLNIAVELSLEYDTRNIELSLIGAVRSKWDLTMKYARDTNNTGSGFVDLIGCPTSITMSGTIALPSTFASTILYESWSVVCRGVYNTFPLSLYFNALKTDLEFAQYQGYQIPINTTTRTGTFWDSDATSLSVNASYPLSSDGIDDGFNSDNYSAYSTGTTLYPSGYTDDDDDARRMQYGYVVEDSGLYNVFWSNSEMKNYIAANTANNHPVYRTLWNTGTWYLHLDINSSHRLVLYKLDANSYTSTKEMKVLEKVSGTGQIARIGYLQNNLSLSPVKTGTWEYIFDFNTYDYALFIENTSSGALLYRLRWEKATTGSGIYINPLQDQDPSILSYLWSHVFIDDEGKLITEQMEVFGFK